MKNKTIIVKCTEIEYEHYKELAKLNNVSISDMVRISIGLFERVNKKGVKICELSLPKNKG